MRRFNWIARSIAVACAFGAHPSAAQLSLPPHGEESIGQTYTGRTYSPSAERDFGRAVCWGRAYRRVPGVAVG